MALRRERLSSSAAKFLVHSPRLYAKPSHAIRPRRALSTACSSGRRSSPTVSGALSKKRRGPFIDIYVRNVVQNENLCLSYRYRGVSTGRSVFLCDGKATEPSERDTWSTPYSDQQQEKRKRELLERLERERLLERDQLLRAHIGDLRVSAIRCTKTLQEAQARWGFGEAAAHIWGQYMAGAMMFASFLKGEERIKLEISNNKVFRNLMVECIGIGEVRGFIQPPQFDLVSSIEALDSQGTMTVSKVLYNRAKPYITVVPSRCSPKKDWCDYYLSSEQVDTHVLLQATIDSNSGHILFCGGLTAQVMPPASPLLGNKPTQTVQNDTNIKTAEAASGAKEASVGNTSPEAFRASSERSSASNEEGFEERVKAAPGEDEGVVRHPVMDVLRAMDVSKLLPDMATEMNTKGVKSYVNTLITAILAEARAERKHKRAGQASTEGSLEVLASSLEEARIIPVDFHCRCSKENFVRGLERLPTEELVALQEDKDRHALRCHCCNAEYVLTRNDITEIIEQRSR